MDIILQVISNLISGAIGASVGALVTYKSIDKTHRNNIEILNIADKRETKATIKAIITELEGLKYILINEFGAKLSLKDECLWYSYPLDTDYFTIYNSNASK
ncbi:MAG: hypothetical protein R3Y28_03935 [Candidatus Gastranaerophilales bacterium]